MQKRITFLFTECYKHFAEKIPKNPVSAMYFAPPTAVLVQKNTLDNQLTLFKP